MPRIVSSFKTTATIQVGSKSQIGTKGYAGIQKHVERQYKNDGNQNIDFSKSKYNFYGSAANYTALLHKHFDEYIKIHDEKQKRSDRKYKNLKGFLKGKSADKVVVATFGSKETKDLFIKQFMSKNSILDTDANLRLVTDSYLKAVSAGLKNYCEKFNQRHTNLKICKFGTNVDELGAPHAHIQLVPLGKTKKGKPSYSFNSALSSEYGDYESPNNALLKRFRAEEDKRLVDMVGSSVIAGLEHDFSKYIKNDKSSKFELLRLGETCSLSMDDYRKAKERDENANNQLIHFNRNRSFLDRQKNEIASNQKLLETQQYQIKTNDEILKKQTSLLDRFENFYEKVKNKIKSKIPDFFVSDTVSKTKTDMVLKNDFIKSMSTPSFSSLECGSFSRKVYESDLNKLSEKSKKISNEVESFHDDDLEL